MFNRINLVENFGKKIIPMYNNDYRLSNIYLTTIMKGDLSWTINKTKNKKLLRLNK